MSRVSAKLSAAGLVCCLVAIISRVSHDARADVKDCVKSSTNVCENCQNTGNVFQCDTQSLPTGYDYGSCVSVTGKCYKEDHLYRCSQFTYTCDTPKKWLEGDTTCLYHMNVPICAEVKPDEPSGGG